MSGFVLLKKIHDLGLPAEELQNYIEVDEKYLEICDELTPYGVKIRYPQELFLEERHATKALNSTREIYKWLDSNLDKNSQEKKNSISQKLRQCKEQASKQEGKTENHVQFRKNEIR